MADKVPKTGFSFRLDPEMVRRFDERARGDQTLQYQHGKRGGTHKDRDVGRTAAVERLMELYAAGRLAVLPDAGANPFPADEVPAGESPDHPITITRPL